MADVSDIGDEELLRRVMTHLATRLQGPRPAPLWSVVAIYFALGSTYAAQLCRRFYLNPDKAARP